MGLEVATYISGLNASNPVGVSDPKSQGDDHLRLIKSTLLNTFPNINSVVSATPAELNRLVGVTGVTGTGKLVLDAAPTIAGATLTGSTLTGPNISSPAISGTATGNYTNSGIILNTARQHFEGTPIPMTWWNTGGAANAKGWDFSWTGDNLIFGLVNDAYSTRNNFMLFQRSGQSPTSVDFYSRVSFAAQGVAAGYSIFRDSGSQLTFSGGTSGFQWNNNANSVALMTLSNAGALTLIKANSGTPATSGSSDSNTVAAIGAGSVAVDFGVYGSGITWQQSRFVADKSGNFAHYINPNGGTVLVGPGGIISPVAVSLETSGNLTVLSAHTHINLSGGITLNSAVFAANTKMTMEAGGSDRVITRGAGCTMYVNGVDSATATLPANTVGGIHVRSASVFVLTGVV